MRGVNGEAANARSEWMERIQPPQVGQPRPANPAVHTFIGSRPKGFETLDLSARTDRVEQIALQCFALDGTYMPVRSTTQVVFAVFGRNPGLDPTVPDQPVSWDVIVLCDGGIIRLPHARSIHTLSLYSGADYAYTVWITGDDTELPE